MEKIVNMFVNSFKGITSKPFGKEIIIIILSMLPIIELRGGILAASLLDMSPFMSYIICIIANMIPVPIILWFVAKVLDWMKTTKSFGKLATKIEEKALSKKSQIDKYGYWGLALFVGIPLPGTGAWTGCLIASLLEMDKKKAMLATCLGVLMAGVIMMILSFGVLKAIF